MFVYASSPYFIRILQGPLQVEEKWRDLYPFQVRRGFGVEEKVDQQLIIVKTCTPGLRDLLMTKIDLEVRRVKSEALS